MTNKKQIKLYSRNKESLKRFIKLLKKTNTKWKNSTLISKSIKNKKKRTTVLKSPHVNKKAQTHFQQVVFSTLVTDSTLRIKKDAILLKKIKNHIFSDIKIKIKQTIFADKTKALIKKELFPKRIYYYKSTKNFFEKQRLKLFLTTFNNTFENKKTLLKKTLKFLKVLDLYGAHN